MKGDNNLGAGCAAFASVGAALIAGLTLYGGQFFLAARGGRTSVELPFGVIVIFALLIIAVAFFLIVSMGRSARMNAKLSLDTAEVGIEAGQSAKPASAQAKAKSSLVWLWLLALLGTLLAAIVVGLYYQPSLIGWTGLAFR